MPMKKKGMARKMASKGKKMHATRGKHTKSRVAGKSTKYCKAGV